MLFSEAAPPPRHPAGRTVYVRPSRAGRWHTILLPALQHPKHSRQRGAAVAAILARPLTDWASQPSSPGGSGGKDVRNLIGRIVEPKVASTAKGQAAGIDGMLEPVDPADPIVRRMAEVSPVQAWIGRTRRDKAQPGYQHRICSICPTRNNEI